MAGRPKLIFVSGACGAGKTEIVRLGYWKLREAFGGDVAAIDTDTVWMFIDPRWEFRHPENERHGALTRQQWALLARSYFDFGFAAVIIAGNAVWHLGEVLAVAHAIADVADAFHVTLDPALEVIYERVARRGGDKTPEWLRTHVEWMRGHYAEGWTYRIDNSAMTPTETLREIVRAADSGDAALALTAEL